MSKINKVTVCPFAFSKKDFIRCNENCVFYENKECKLALALEKIIGTKEKESV